MPTRKPKPLLKPLVNLSPVPVVNAKDVRRTVIKEVLLILETRRQTLLEEMDEHTFNGKRYARVEECREIEKEVMKLLQGS